MQGYRIFIANPQKKIWDEWIKKHYKKENRIFWKM